MKDTLLIVMGNEDNEVYAEISIDEPDNMGRSIIISSVDGMMDATEETNYGKDWRFVVEFAEAGKRLQVLCKEGDYPNVHVEDHNVGDNTEVLYEGDMGYYYAADMLKEWIAGGIDEA